MVWPLSAAEAVQNVHRKRKGRIFLLQTQFAGMRFFRFLERSESAIIKKKPGATRARCHDDLTTASAVHAGGVNQQKVLNGSIA